MPTSRDPNELLNDLRSQSAGFTVITITPAEADWLLAQLKHKDDQLEALRKMVRPPTLLADQPQAETVCQEADRVVSLDRQVQYGAPSEDFARTAAMWEPLLGLPPGAISPEKIAYCMIAVKLSRLCHGYKHDSVVDICGYAKTASLICE